MERMADRIRVFRFFLINKQLKKGRQHSMSVALRFFDSHVQPLNRCIEGDFNTSYMERAESTMVSGLSREKVMDNEALNRGENERAED